MVRAVIAPIACATLGFGVTAVPAAEIGHFAPGVPAIRDLTMPAPGFYAVIYTTFAAWAGGEVPDDRVMDSIGVSDFLTGRQEGSGRESVIVYVGNDIFGVKWRNWKMMTKELDVGFGAAIKEFAIPAFYNLHLDPREEHPVLNSPPNLWIRYPAGQALVEHAGSLQREPPIRPGTPDPYLPPAQAR